MKELSDIENTKSLNSAELNSVPNAKPFLKWAGGKSQLLEKFYDFYPEELKIGEIKSYYEPFVGGGAVFFDVAQRFNIKSAVLYDINQELILIYLVIQQNVNELTEILHSFKMKYSRLDSDSRIKFFYEVRNEFNRNLGKINFSKYNEDWILRAAQIIFLNKTCFNGLFRFNRKGEFNVPAGSYKNPKILDEENLCKVSNLLKIAEIKNSGFETVEFDIAENSFVYFDPPYRPISKTAGFTSYSKFKFEDAEQIKLAELYYRLNQKGIRLMLSNSDPKNMNGNDNFFDEIYGDFKISRISARRMINSDASKRDSINEIVVTNY